MQCSKGKFHPPKYFLSRKVRHCFHECTFQFLPERFELLSQKSFHFRPRFRKAASDVTDAAKEPPPPAAPPASPPAAPPSTGEAPAAPPPASGEPTAESKS